MRFSTRFTSPVSGAGVVFSSPAESGELKGLVMNGDGNNRDGTEQTEDEVLTCEISDEALEAAAGVPGYPNVTERFTSFGVNNCLLC